MDVAAALTTGAWRRRGAALRHRSPPPRRQTSRCRSRAIRNDAHVVPTRLRPVRRTQQPRVIASLSEARDRIAGTAWFLKCGIRDGQPDDALWLNNLSEWPGPEDPRCAEFALLGQALYDELVSQGQSLADTFWEIERLARADAAKYSVGYSDAEDTWHPPTARVCEAAW